MLSEFYLEFFPYLNEEGQIKTVSAHKIWQHKPKPETQGAGTLLVKMQVEIPSTWFDIPLIDASIPVDNRVESAVAALQVTEQQLSQP